MLKIFKWSAIFVAVMFAAAQFVRPAKTNPPVEEAKAVQAYLKVPPQVDAIFRRACYDCHSNETVWPWYSNLAPASWFLAGHVDHGRKHLNFSDWARAERRAPNKNASAQVDDICKEVRGGGMPLDSYLILHPEARLSDQDVKVICDWAESERRRLAHESARQALELDQ
jgi:hypothetical protein